MKGEACSHSSGRCLTKSLSLREIGEGKKLTELDPSFSSLDMSGGFLLGS